MRITLLCTSSLDYPSPRGRWLPVARELVARGHEVQLLMLHHTYDLLPAWERRRVLDGVVVHYVSQMHVYGPVGQRRYFGPLELLRVSLMASLRLMLAALQCHSDIVHVCKPQPINGLAGWLAARLTGARLLVDCDDYEAGGNRFGAPWQQRMVQLWEDRLPQYAAGVTVNTRFLQQRYQELGVAAERIAYVPNGISADQRNASDSRLLAGLRAGLGLDDRPVIAYVGTLSQTTHNVGLLLEAFALVVRRVPSARLLLVGDGEDRRALQQQCRALGLAQQVLFTGPVPSSAVPAFLKLAVCSVDPVDDDAVARARSPLKVVESLAVGVPVVTGAVGDRAEMIGAGAGVLVRPGEPQSLADGIVSLLESAQLHTTLAAGARARADDYLWQNLAASWLSLYN